MLLPREAARAARIVALLTAIAGCAVAFVGAMQQSNPGEVTDDCQGSMDSSARRQLFSGRRRHQPGAGGADRPGGRRGYFIFVEHREAHEGIFRLLPRVHRRRVRRVPELRRAAAVRVLRTDHHPEIFPHRALGQHAQGIRRDETGALFICRQPSGAHRVDRRVGGGARPNRPCLARFGGTVESGVPVEFPALGVSRWCSSASRFWRACGRSTRGRRPATSPRPPPARCCWPAW